PAGAAPLVRGAVHGDRRLPEARRRRRVKHVRQFSANAAEGGARDKLLLGGKGANLAEMAGLGLPVPPGFTITTEVCRHVMEHGVGNYPEHLADEVSHALARVEQMTKHKFGDAKTTLLVSVRNV